MENTNQFKVAGKTKVVNGSILNPTNAGLCFILSVNNLAGKAEGNPLLPVFDKKWKKVREESRGWFTNRTGAYKTGSINTTAVQSNVWLLHMLCQDENLKVDEKGLEECLKATAKLAISEKASVHISNILVDALPASFKDLVVKHFVNNSISVYFYDHQE